MKNSFGILQGCLALIAVLSAGAVCLADHRIALGKVVAAANRMPVGELIPSALDSLVNKMPTKTDSSITEDGKRSEGSRRFHSVVSLLPAVMATLSFFLMPNGSE